MKLKSSLLLMGLLVLGSCANSANEFRISKFYPIAAGCDIEAGREKAITPNAYLDVAAGNPSVVVGVVVDGAENIKQGAITIGAVELERPDRNRPIVTSMVVTYRLSKRVGGTPKPYVQNLTLPFDPQTGEIFGAVQLLSPELGQALVDGLLASPGTAPSNVIEDFVDINMDVEFRGEWSATRNAFTTGTLTYPVRAYKSNPGNCMSDAAGVFPFIKATDPNTGGVDICAYVGFVPHQLGQPAVPVCCPARDPMAGTGC